MPQTTIEPTQTQTPISTPTPTVSPTLTTEFQPSQDITTAEALAKTAYGEARGCSTTEQAAVMWCVLNRVDSDDPYYPDDVVSVVSQTRQFHGYHPDHPVTPELLALAEDVLYRWSIETECVGNVGRILPSEYLFFYGDGEHNHFTTEYGGETTWDWSLPSPYQH